MKFLLFFLLAFVLTTETLAAPLDDAEEQTLFEQGEDDHFLPREMQHHSFGRDDDDDDFHVPH